jgi:hypothetical protein
MIRHGARALALLALLGAAATARAADICPAGAGPDASYAARIARIACGENRLWYRPFITDEGRLASVRVSEAETYPLADGATPAWRRVVDYWRGSGLLPSAAGRPGAADCAVAAPMSSSASACRVFVIDTPWSATFVSWVLVSAGLPGFRASPSHYDFLRDAWGRPGSPFRFVDPHAEAPAAGDLLCFARMPSVFGPMGFRDYLANHPDGAMAMHCDIVVENVATTGRLYTVSGNVLQGVSLRILDVNHQGLLWNLPQRATGDMACQPESPSACNFNRQDWVALLKLKPLPPPPAAVPAQPSAPACCTACTLPMPPGVRRCPAPAPAPTVVPQPSGG